MRKRLPSMGTVFEVQIVGACPGKSDESVYLEIQKQLDALESEMSLYQTQSTVSQLNRDGVVKKYSSDFLAVLKLSLSGAEKTRGAFDPTVLPVLIKIQNSFQEKHVPPAPEDLDNLRSLVDYHAVNVDNSKIEFKKKGMKISFDGLAKGYAVDKVAEALEKKGIGNYLLNFSGNMRWQGHRRDGKYWRIQIWDPVRKTGIDLAPTKSGAVSSSGSGINFFSTDKKWHHLIDPKNLRPARRWAATAVWGPSAAICDLLSTATFVMSKENAEAILKENFREYHMRAIEL